MKDLVPLNNAATPKQKHKAKSKGKSKVQDTTPRRLIKIRLADPSDPESYVCEIYDTSIEDEEPTKPQGKTFFDVLMSEESRRNFQVISAFENEMISENTKRNRVDEDPNILKERKKKRALTKKRLDELTVLKKRKLCVDSSDEDECLLQVQSTLRKSKQESKENMATLLDNNDDDIDIDVVTPASVQASNILSYFSKLKKESTPLQDKSIQKKKVQRKEEIRKVKKSMNPDVKLAPMFMKKAVKVVDAAANTAKLNFLYSGIPKKKTVEVERRAVADTEVEYFPSVSHVQQRDADPVWITREIHMALRPVEESMRWPNQRFNYRTKETKHWNVKCDVKLKKVKDLMSLYSTVDINNMYKDLSLKHQVFKKKEKEMLDAQDKILDDSVEVIEEVWADAPNPLWLEKYRPDSGSSILGNSLAVDKMRRWLDAWKTFDTELKKPEKKNGGSEDDSNDFVSSDEESSHRVPNTACVLQGGVATGKTALVYALAAQMQFGVLEINASSKRTGSKLLSDLQEATQSHKVQQTKPTANPISCMLSKKKKPKKKQKAVKKEEVASQKKTMSLILIEDCDIVFDEYDAGFISAVISLIQISKRPVVLTWSSTNNQQLEKLAHAHNTLSLNMVRPTLDDACAFLECVLSVEGVASNSKELRSLVERTGRDLRRGLLELQLWSDQQVPVVESLYTSAQLWWQLHSFLYNTPCPPLACPSDHLVEKPPQQTRPRGTDTCGKLARVLDLMSVSDVLTAGFSNAIDTDPVFSLRGRVLDGLSLNECPDKCCFAEARLALEMSSDVIRMSCDWFNKERTAPWLVAASSSDNAHRTSWRTAHEAARSELQSFVSISTDHKALYLDYLPGLRGVCRSENERMTANTKRKNRFMHYLRTIGGRVSEEKLSWACQALSSESLLS